jgi:hypothetical protein
MVPYADRVSRFFTKKLEELTLGCKTNWPHPVPVPFCKFYKYSMHRAALTFPPLQFFTNFFHLIFSKVCLLSNAKQFCVYSIFISRK